MALAIKCIYQQKPFKRNTTSEYKTRDDGSAFKCSSIFLNIFKFSFKNVPSIIREIVMKYAINFLGNFCSSKGDLPLGRKFHVNTLSSKL